jgi:hypothetical protein
VRTDEGGNPCPGTLGEYLDLCEGLGGPACKAVAFLKKKIEEAEKGRDEEVIAPDSQMRMLLMPMLLMEG